MVCGISMDRFGSFSVVPQHHHLALALCNGLTCHYIQLHQHLYRQVILYSSLYKIPNLNSDRIKKMKYSFALKFSFS